VLLHGCCFLKKNTSQASKLEAWANETAAEKGKRETSFQLMARYKFLKKTPPFDQLSDDEVAKIAGVLEVKDFAAGQAIVVQGDMGDSFYIIETGSVDVLVQTGSSSSGSGSEEKDEGGQRKEQLKVATLSAGKAFGEMSLLDNAPRMATCRAVRLFHGCGGGEGRQRFCQWL